MPTITDDVLDTRRPLNTRSISVHNHPMSFVDVGQANTKAPALWPLSQCRGKRRSPVDMSVAYVWHATYDSTESEALVPN